MADALSPGITAQLANFQAASEFGDSPAGVFDRRTAAACGQRAFSLFQHCKWGKPLGSAEIIALVEDMAAHGYAVAGGTVMGDLVAYFSHVGGLDVVYTNGYGSSWDAIHQTLLAHAGRDGAVVEVEEAWRLPGNEQGVFRHYVGVGGIHPVAGYLIGNGDDVMGLAQNHGHGKTYPARWITRDQLAAARPSACAVIRGLSYVTDGEGVTPPEWPAHFSVSYADLAPSAQGRSDPGEIGPPQDGPLEATG